MPRGVHDMVYKCKDEKVNVVSFLSGNLAFSASLFGPFVTATISQLHLMLIQDRKSSTLILPRCILCKAELSFDHYVPHVEDLP